MTTLPPTTTRRSTRASIRALAASLAGAAVALALGACAGTPTLSADRVLKQPVTGSPDTPPFGGLLDDPAEHRVQVLISEVVTDPATGKTTLRRSGFRVDAEYFYPASTIKVCAGIAALERLNAVRAGGRADINEDTPLAFAQIFPNKPAEDRDPTNLQGGFITLRHELRKMFLVSDNPAFNRLYDVAGQREVNERMWAAGLSSVRITHRLSEARTPAENRRTPSVEMRAPAGTLTLAERDDGLVLTNRGLPGLAVGSAYLSGDRRVDQPMDFSTRNRISLVDLQDMLVLLARPDIDLGKPGFNLTPEQRQLLLDAAAQYPRQSTNPVYDPKTYPDEWGKFLLPGITRVVDQADVRIVNKVGQAYGFTLENAYIELVSPDSPPAARRAVFVTAVVYTNEDAVLNDDRYEYDQRAFPFMADLGEAVARSMGWGDARTLAPPRN